MDLLKPQPPQPLNGQNLLSMTKGFLLLLASQMILLNYKNDSSTNVSKYYMLELYLANTKHFYGNCIL